MQKKFRGRLNIPFYLLLWRDTHSGVYAIQEEAPYNGTQQEKDDYVNRWQAVVDDAIAAKHQNVSESLEKPQKNTNLTLVTGIPTPAGAKR